jgi:hypothetical protein
VPDFVFEYTGLPCADELSICADQADECGGGDDTILNCPVTCGTCPDAQSFKVNLYSSGDKLVLSFFLHFYKISFGRVKIVLLFFFVLLRQTCTSSTLASW